MKGHEYFQHKETEAQRRKISEPLYGNYMLKKPRNCTNLHEFLGLELKNLRIHSNDNLSKESGN
jgi:hypothetical protein